MSDIGLNLRNCSWALERMAAIRVFGKLKALQQPPGPWSAFRSYASLRAYGPAAIVTTNVDV